MKQMVLIAVIVLVSACASSGGESQAQASTTPGYADAHAAAVAAIAYSAERGHAWSTSDTLLEEAVAAHANGDDDLAIELANNARMQAELAAEQADIEEKTWSGRVLSD